MIKIPHSETQKSQKASPEQLSASTESSPSFSENNDILRATFFKKFDAAGKDVEALASTLRPPDAQNKADRIASQPPGETLEAQVKKARDHTENLANKISTAYERVEQIQAELLGIDQSEKTARDYIKNPPDEFERKYAQKKLGDAIWERVKLNEELSALQSELTALHDRHQQAQRDHQDLQHQLVSYTPRFEGGVTTTRINEAQKQVHTHKEQIYSAIKAHEALLKRSEHRQRNASAERKVKKLSTGLQKAQTDLELLRQKAPAGIAPEKNPRMEASTLLWDATRSCYETQQYLDEVAKQFEELEKKQKVYHEQKISPPNPNQQDATYDQWTELSVYQEQLYKRYDDMKLIQKSYLDIIDNLHDKQLLCHEFLNKTKHAIKDMSSADNRNEMARIHEKLQYIGRSMQERYQSASEQVKQIEGNLEAFKNGDLARADAEANEKEKELQSKLPPDHLYFPWYERSEYDAKMEGRRSFRSRKRNGCLAAAALTRLSDYPASVFDIEKITPEQVEEALQLTPAGASIKDIPAAFEKLKVPERYEVTDLWKTNDDPLTSLEKLLEYGSAIVRFYQKDAGGHFVVVDKFERDPAAGMEYVYVRDQLGGVGDEGSSYKVGGREFMNSWDPKAVAVPAKSLSLL